MVKSHYVLIAGPSGKAATHSLKQWLRENPEENPPGMHPDENTSHELRRGLKKLGWRLQFTPSEVLIIKPDHQGGTSYADELIDAKDEEDWQSFSEDSEQSIGSLGEQLKNALKNNNS